MLIEPFTSNLGCIEAVTRFLLGRLDKSAHLWHESLEDEVNIPNTLSIWATCDVWGALLEVAEFSKTIESTGFKTLRTDILVKSREVADALMSFRDQFNKRAASQWDSDCESLQEKAKKDLPSWLLEALETLAAAHGAIGMPRTYTRGGALAPGEAAWGEAAILPGCALDKCRRQVLAIDDDGRRYDRLSHCCSSFAGALAHPEWVLLRRVLSIVSRRVDQYRSLENAPELAYRDIYAQYVRELALHPCAVGLATMNATPSGNPLGILTDFICKNRDLTRGVLCMDSHGAGGWQLVPAQVGAGIDPLATLAALEVLAARLAAVWNEDQAELLFAALEFGVTFTERSLYALVTGEELSDEDGLTSDRLTELKATPKLSARLSLDFAARFVVLAEAACESLAQLPNDPSDSRAQRASSTRNRLAKLLSLVYVGLFLRTYDVVVDQGAVPFEPTPATLLAGNEITQWPGIDVGLVALALLRGRTHFPPTADRRDFAELRPVLTRLSILDSDNSLPASHPLIATVVSLTKSRLVGHYNLHNAWGALPPRVKPLVDEHGDNGAPLIGAFLSSAALASGQRESCVYLWATAHALRAIVEWEKATNTEATKRQLDVYRRCVEDYDAATKAREKLDAVLAPVSILQSFRVGTLVSLALVVLILGVSPTRVGDTLARSVAFEPAIVLRAAPLAVATAWFAALAVVLFIRMRRLMAGLGLCSSCRPPLLVAALPGSLAIWLLFVLFNTDRWLVGYIDTHLQHPIWDVIKLAGCLALPLLFGWWLLKHIKWQLLLRFIHLVRQLAFFAPSAPLTAGQFSDLEQAARAFAADDTAQKVEPEKP